MKMIIIVTLALTLLVSLVVTGTGCNLIDYSFCLANPSIDLEVYVSVDHGITWEDADSTAIAPDIVKYDYVKYKYVVTNTGDVELVNIKLIDPMHQSLIDSDITIVDPLPSLASFEGTIGFNSPLIYASFAQQEDTAAATGDYNGVTYMDTDVTYYTCIEE